MMRLDKYLADAGLGSRKEVKSLIKKKKVLVNNQLVTKDDYKVDENKDAVTVENKLVEYRQFHYFMLNKPQGVISATEDGKYKTVLNCIQEPFKDLFPVGRLDIDTEGLLLITNDGTLAHELLSPKKHVEKCYYLTIKEPLTNYHLEQIEKGIEIDQHEICKPARIELIDQHHALLWITEGKFHQVKRMIAACQSEVLYLKRLSMGPLKLDEQLELGDYRRLKEEEVSALLQLKEK